MEIGERRRKKRSEVKLRRERGEKKRKETAKKRE